MLFSNFANKAQIAYCAKQFFFRSQNNFRAEKIAMNLVDW